MLQSRPSSFSSRSSRRAVWAHLVTLSSALGCAALVACGSESGSLDPRVRERAPANAGDPSGSGATPGTSDGNGPTANTGDPAPGTGDTGTPPASGDGDAGPTIPVGKTPEEKAFRAMQADLVTTCGGTNGACHVTGTVGGAGLWLAAPDPYLSAKKYPGIVVADPATSKLMIKGPHAGPGFTGPTKPLGDKVLAWLTLEAAKLSGAALPTTDPVAIAAGPVTVDIAKVGTNVAGAKLTFTAALTGNILTLTKISVVAPAASAVHVVHPIFVMAPPGAADVEDPVDSFSNLDQTVPAGTTAPFGVDTLILSNWVSGAMLKIAFTTLASTTATGGGTTGGCKSVATFTANAVPAIQNNQCLNCHGTTNGSGYNSLDLSQVGKDNAAACAQALNKVDKVNKANSDIILAPTGKVAAHPFKNANANYATMMLNWINNE